MENYQNLIMELLKGETPKEKYDSLMHLAANYKMAINLLKDLQTTYVFDLNSDGEPLLNVNEIISLWQEVTKCIVNR